MPGFIGFAVGRTSFWDPLVDWRGKKITRDAAVAEIARRYQEFVEIFETQTNLFTHRGRTDVKTEADVVKLAPSILAADFARLGEQVAEAEKAGADRIHVDVMDGHFVPNLSMGAPIVQSLRRITRLPLETHLMITDPDLFLEEFAAAGSDSFLVHWEGNCNLDRTVRRIKELGKRAGVVINPATPAAVLEEILPEVDQVLVMTVNPGFGHQHFLRSTLPKIERVRQMVERMKLSCEVEVDGGVDEETAPLAAEAGADVFVAGSSVFGNKAGVAAGHGQAENQHCASPRRHAHLNNSAFMRRHHMQLGMIGLRKNGRQYGAAAHQQRTQLRGLRQVAASSERTGEG